MSIFLQRIYQSPTGVAAGCSSGSSILLFLGKPPLFMLLFPPIWVRPGDILILCFISFFLSFLTKKILKTTLFQHRCRAISQQNWKDFSIMDLPVCLWLPNFPHEAPDSLSCFHFPPLVSPQISHLHQHSFLHLGTIALGLDTYEKTSWMEWPWIATWRM